MPSPAENARARIAALSAEEKAALAPDLAAWAMEAAEAIRFQGANADFEDLLAALDAIVPGGEA